MKLMRGAWLAVLVALSLPACDVFVSPDQRVKRAEAQIAAHDYRSATIELKNALQDQPDHVVAEGVGVDFAGTPLGLTGFGDEAGSLQHLQVLGHRRQAHPFQERLGQVRDIGLALRDGPAWPCGSGRPRPRMSG